MKKETDDSLFEDDEDIIEQNNSSPNTNSSSTTSILMCACSVSSEDEEVLTPVEQKPKPPKSNRKAKRHRGADATQEVNKQTIICCCYHDGDVTLQNANTGDAILMAQLPNHLITGCKFLKYSANEKEDERVVLILMSSRTLFITFCTNAWNKTFLERKEEFSRNLFVSTETQQSPASYNAKNNLPLRKFTIQRSQSSMLSSKQLGSSIQASDILCVDGIFVASAQIYLIAIGHYDGTVSFGIISRDLSQYRELKVNQRLFGSHQSLQFPSNSKNQSSFILATSSDEVAQMFATSATASEEVRCKAVRKISLKVAPRTARGDSNFALLSVMYTTGAIKLFSLSFLVANGGAVFNIMITAAKQVVASVENPMDMKVYTLNYDAVSKLLLLVSGKDKIQLIVEEKGFTGTPTNAASQILPAPFQHYSILELTVPNSLDLHCVGQGSLDHIFIMGTIFVNDNDSIIYCADNFGLIYKHSVNLFDDGLVTNTGQNTALPGSAISNGAVNYTTRAMKYLANHQIRSFPVGLVCNHATSKLHVYDHLNHVIEV